MPTLASDLTSPQRAWLFETFGHYGDVDELQPVSHYHSRESRRFSDVTHEMYHYQGSGDFDEYIPENRNSIFRSGRSGCRSQMENPIPWSPTERYDNYNSRGLLVRHSRPNRNDNAKRQSESGGTVAPQYPHMEEKLTWMQSYENLQVYKLTYGDCNVPQKYRHNVKLGGWVVSISKANGARRVPITLLTSISLFQLQNKQRKKKKNPSKYGKLTEIQLSDLEDLGFKWMLDNGC